MMQCWRQRNLFRQFVVYARTFVFVCSRCDAAKLKGGYIVPNSNSILNSRDFRAKELKRIILKNKTVLLCDVRHWRVETVTTKSALKIIYATINWQQWVDIWLIGLWNELKSDRRRTNTRRTKNQTIRIKWSQFEMMMIYGVFPTHFLHFNQLKMHLNYISVSLCQF